MKLRLFAKLSLLVALWAMAWQACALSIKVSQAAEVLFARNDALMPDEAELQTFYELALKARRITLEMIIVIGFADANERNPMLLSKTRAELIQKKLIDLGIPKERIYLEGEGAKRLLAAVGDKRNRRVEIELVGTPSISWVDWERRVQDTSLTWQFLNVAVAKNNGENRSVLPSQWRSPERDQLPLLEFIQTIGDPVWREVFANKLLIEAIWRRDDVLTQTAFEERQIARVILDKTNRYSQINGYPNAALEAAAYGTAFAKKLTFAELPVETTWASPSADKLVAVACTEPAYAPKTDELVIEAARTLFPVEQAMQKIPPRLQKQMLSCLHERFSKAFTWMLDQGAYPDVTNELGQTFLHLDILRRGANHTAALLKAKASLNATDFLGNTPLHYVNQSTVQHIGHVTWSTPRSKLEKQNLWDALVAAGANLNILNRAGSLPLKP